MAASRILEHHSIKLDDKGCFFQLDHLFKYKETTISVSTTYNSNNTKKPNYLQIKNADTDEIIWKLELCSYLNRIKTNDLKVFIHSDSNLWIGIHNSHRDVWIFDLSNLNWTKKLSFCPASQIKLVGNKCFYVPGANSTFQVHKWSDLLNPNNPNEPIYTFPRNSTLFDVDWSSSSIKKLAECVYIRQYFMSTQIDLIDGEFKFICSSDILDLFQNYQPLQPVELDEQIEEQVINEYDTNIIKFTTNIIDNILLYWEYREPIVDKNKNILKTGQTNIYCWDFTTNSQVKFTNYDLNVFIHQIIPFRALPDATNPIGKIKYIASEYFGSKSWYKIYESV